MKRQILRKVMLDNDLDLIYSTSEQTRLWFASVQTSAGSLFIEKNAETLFVDGRYIEYVESNAKNVDVRLVKSNKDIMKFLEKKTIKKVGIEKEYLTISEFDNIKKLLPNSEFVSISAVELRIVKDKEEITSMKEAGKIALLALAEAAKLIKPGVSEKEIDAELERQIRLFGGQKGSFDAVVASGPRGAMPHARASERIMNEGEFVTIDFGAYFKGYASDITRTFHVGTVTDLKLLEIEEILKEAQSMGKKAVKPGVTTGEIDKICRDYITEKGFGQYFVHSTGHGLGIDVHELPNVTQTPGYSRMLEPGMVITVEPGIYIEGFGGIRIEDDVLVTKTGYEVLSSF